jgi:hypothetical protein
MGPGCEVGRRESQGLVRKEGMGERPDTFTSRSSLRSRSIS